MPLRTRLEPGCGPTPRAATDTEFVIGLDLDRRALRSGRRDGADVCGDASSLPLGPATIDEIELRAVLHHLDPVEDALREFARVLRPSGRLRVIDGVALTSERAAQLAAELIAAGRDPEPIPGFDVEQLTSTIASLGFDVESARLDGTATFATHPIVSEDYVTERFVLEARRVSSTSK